MLNRLTKHSWIDRCPPAPVQPHIFFTPTDANLLSVPVRRKLNIGLGLGGSDIVRVGVRVRVRVRGGLCPNHSH